MKLSQEFKIASEFREKVHLAEDQLRNEKKNLYKAQTMMLEEKEKWITEEKEQKEKISQMDAELREKEARYEDVKAKCMEVMQRTGLLESENDVLRKEIQRVKVQKDDDMCKYLLEQGNLELELSKIREWQSDLKVSHKLKKALQMGVPGEGRKELPKESPTGGKNPADGKSLTEGKTTAEKKNPSEGKSPVEGKTVVDKKNPPEGKNPAEGKTPADGKSPSDWKNSTEGKNQTDGKNSNDGKKPSGKTNERKMKAMPNNLAEITPECEQTESKTKELEEETAFMDKLQ